MANIVILSCAHHSWRDDCCLRLVVDRLHGASSVRVCGVTVVWPLLHLLLVLGVVHIELFSGSCIAYGLLPLTLVDTILTL